jgi:hypothetical protein
MEVSGRLHGPASLRPLSPRYQMDRRLGALQCQSERHGGVNVPDPTVTRTPTFGSSNVYRGVIPTALPRFCIYSYLLNLWFMNRRCQYHSLCKAEL